MSAKQDPQDRAVREVLRHLLYIEDALKGQSSKKIAEKLGLDRAAISRHKKEIETIAEKDFLEPVDGKGWRLTEDGREFKKVVEDWYSASHKVLAYLLRGKFLQRHKNCSPFQLPYTTNFQMVPLIRGAQIPNASCWLTVCKSCMVPFWVNADENLKIWPATKSPEGYYITQEPHCYNNFPATKFFHKGYLYTPDFLYVSFSGECNTKPEKFLEYALQSNKQINKERILLYNGNAPPYIPNPDFLDQLP